MTSIVELRRTIKFRLTRSISFSVDELGKLHDRLDRAIGILDLVRGGDELLLLRTISYSVAESGVTGNRNKILAMIEEIRSTW